MHSLYHIGVLVACLANLPIAYAAETCGSSDKPCESPFGIGEIAVVPVYSNWDTDSGEDDAGVKCSEQTRLTLEEAREQKLAASTIQQRARISLFSNAALLERYRQQAVVWPNGVSAFLAMVSYIGAARKIVRRRRFISTAPAAKARLSSLRTSKARLSETEQCLTLATAHS